MRDASQAENSTAPRWDRPGVPHRGWTCIQITDLEDAVHTCEMCGREEIRYVHSCTHPNYPGRLDVGCKCVSEMTGDYTGPRQRVSAMRNRAKRRSGWLGRKWHCSRKGGESIDLRDGPNVGVFPVRFGSGWKYRIGSRFSDCAFRDSDVAKLALFDALYPGTVRVSASDDRAA